MQKLLKYQCCLVKKINETCKNYFETENPEQYRTLLYSKLVLLKANSGT